MRFHMIPSNYFPDAHLNECPFAFLILSLMHIVLCTNILPYCSLSAHHNLYCNISSLDFSIINKLVNMQVVEQYYNK